MGSLPNTHHFVRLVALIKEIDIIFAQIKNPTFSERLKKISEKLEVRVVEQAVAHSKELVELVVTVCSMSHIDSEYSVFGRLKYSIGLISSSSFQFGQK